MFIRTLYKSCTSAKICNTLPTPYSDKHSSVFIAAIRVYLFKLDGISTTGNIFGRNLESCFWRILFYCQRSDDPEFSELYATSDCWPLVGGCIIYRVQWRVAPTFPHHPYLFGLFSCFCRNSGGLSQRTVQYTVTKLIATSSKIL
jgi:hypothetical protein